MQSKTKHLTTTATVLSLGFLLSGSLAMAADAPAVTPSIDPASANIYPHWTPEQRQQYWVELQQKANDLWTKWGLTQEQGQQYWEQMQRWWQMNMSPEQRHQYWVQLQLKANELWTKWGLSPEQRQQYTEQMRGLWNDLGTMMNAPVETPPTVPAIAAVAPAAANPPGMMVQRRAHYPWSTWGMTAEQRQQHWAKIQRGN